MLVFIVPEVYNISNCLSYSAGYVRRGKGCLLHKIRHYWALILIVYFYITSISSLCIVSLYYIFALFPRNVFPLTIIIIYHVAKIL